MSKAAIFLITGYLGSGKTTFIKNILNTFNGEEKIAIIQNEFAPANVDGDDIKRNTTKDFELLEVNNGSVFCVCLLAGFVKSLKAFVEKHRPSLIIMEASGLSDPVSIGQIFGSPELKDEVYLGGVICIIDAVNFAKMHSKMTQIAHQIMIADHILINKTDLACNIEEINLAINKINPLAHKYQTVQGKLPSGYYIDINNEVDQAITKSFFFLHTKSERPNIQSVVLKATNKMALTNIERFLKKVSEKCYRLKGTMVLEDEKVISVQLVSGHYEYREIGSSSKQTELIGIGQGMNPDYLKLAYDEACKAC